jgi:hypothetical protein
LFVCEALSEAGATPHLAEPAETRALRGPKRRAKTDREDARRHRCSPSPTSCRAPISPSGPSSSVVMTVSHDIGREGIPDNKLRGAGHRGHTPGRPLSRGRTVLARTSLRLLLLGCLLTGLLAGAAQAQPVYSEAPGLSPPEVKPRAMHGGSDFGWQNLIWSSWGGAVAQGSGIYRQRVFDASDVPSWPEWPVTMRLSRLQRCFGYLYYPHREVAFPGGQPPDVFDRIPSDFPCPRSGWGIDQADGSIKGLYKPRTFYFGANGVVRNVRWSSWTTDRAVGRGEALFKYCRPNCAEGKTRWVKTTLTLDRPTSCAKANDDFIFLRFRGSILGNVPTGGRRTYMLSYRAKYYCDAQ